MSFKLARKSRDLGDDDLLSESEHNQEVNESKDEEKESKYEVNESKDEVNESKDEEKESKDEVNESKDEEKENKDEVNESKNEEKENKEDKESKDEEKECKEEKESKDEEKESKEGDNVKEESKEETIGVSKTNININNEVKDRTRTKLNKANLERGPFLITRINTRHKPHSLTLDNNTKKTGRSSSEPNTYKSIHYKTIIDKENHLQQKFQQLSDILERDVLARTSAICDQSLNEARQLIQNSLATSRIISSFITDRQSTSLSLESSERLLTSEERSTTNIPITKNRLTTIMPNKDIHKINNHNEKDNVKEDSSNFSVQNEITQIYTYNLNDNGFNNINDVDEKQTTFVKKSTDHRLTSDEPFIQNWLQSKNKEYKMLKRREIQTQRIERAVSMNAERVLEQRNKEAEEAFKIWCKRKARALQCSVNKVKEDDIKSTSSSEEEYLPQAGRQPRLIHNYVYNKPRLLIRPKTTATFNIRSDLKMKLKGHKMELFSVEDVRETSRISHNLGDSNFNKARPQTALPRARSDTLTALTRYLPSKSPSRVLKKKKRNKSRFVLGDSDSLGNIKPKTDHFFKDEDESDKDKDNDGYNDLQGRKDTFAEDNDHNYNEDIQGRKDTLIEDNPYNVQENLGRTSSIESISESYLFD